MLLFVSKPCRIKVEKGRVVLRTHDGDVVELGSATYDSVVVATRAASITTAALQALAARGIDLTVLGPHGMPVARVYPPIINKTAATRVAQYQAILDGRGLRAAKSILEAKVRNQASVLRYAARSRRDDYYALEAENVERVADDIRRARPDPLELRELEAHAARIYWGAVAKLLEDSGYGFTGRDPQGLDPFNMALNYGYGVLYARCERALLLVGLDPYAGFMHSMKSGQRTLVYDFIEQFRPVVDKALVFARPDVSVSNGVMDRESRRRVAQVVMRALEKEVPYLNGKATVDDVIVRKASELARYLRGELQEYVGFRARF
ncbi:CRISPR-associated endonuclease Cas1 [Infirmifilum lucidum]|uniref:CRISPR-associated endonuclease Cas1 n=1 Tax=Infirmifilum lucidum TaxID=2776706 RepID=A0A7L9FGD3_9CREN|nr:CRISPR-associated endonuclease Cas1 [Infirmifilum lucidum]QOJ78819.1 CRISPR-associated endonuclease Cas1 [Infirmifilum lucidum]